MPQLNPTPWLFILIITWIIIFALLKLMTARLYPLSPVKNTPPHLTHTWIWTWL